MIASYPTGRLSQKELGTEGEENLTDEEIDRLAEMKFPVRGFHPETILTKEQLQNAISELTGVKNLITLFAEDERLNEGATRDRMAVEIGKIADKYNIRANLSEFPGKIGELIEKYNRDLKRLQGK